MQSFLSYIWLLFGLVFLGASATALLVIFGVFPEAWLIPALRSLIACMGGMAFLVFAGYLDYRHASESPSAVVSPLRIALGAAIAFGIVSFFEWFV